MKIKEIMNDTSHLLGLVWEHSESQPGGRVASSLVFGGRLYGVTFNNNCQSIFTLQTKETLVGRYIFYSTKESGAAGRYEGQIGWINSCVLRRSD